MKKLSKKLALWFLAVVLSVNCFSLVARADDAKEYSSQTLVKIYNEQDQGNQRQTREEREILALLGIDCTENNIQVSLLSALSTVDYIEADLVVWVGNNSRIFSEKFYPRAGINNAKLSVYYPGWDWATLSARAYCTDGTSGFVAQRTFTNPAK